MKTTIKTITIAALATIALASCNKDGKEAGDLTNEEKALKAAVEEYVPGVIYDIYGKLADATAELSDALAAIRDGGMAALTQDQINEACSKFLEAREYWEKSEAFLFGAASNWGIDPHIDSWPLDKDKLAKALSSTALIADLREGGAGAADEVGVANLGFHGIEFILFRNGATRALSALKANETDPSFSGYNVSGESELVFAAAVAEDLRNYCWELQVSWNPDAPEARVQAVEELELNTVLDSDMTFGENLLGAGEAGSTYRSWQKAVNTILVAGCSNICNEVANSKIASAYSKEDTDYIESPYSKKSYLDFYNNIQSVVYSLYGKNGATKPSSKCIYSTLKNAGYKGADALKSSLEAAVASLQACLDSDTAFVDNPQAACAGNAITALNALDAELNKAAEFVENI